MTTTKSITLTPAELEAIINGAITAALAANGKAPAKKSAPKAKVAADPKLTTKVLAAIKADPKTTPYTNKQGKSGLTYRGGFSAVIMANAVKKYGESATFDAKTVETVAKAYGIK